jgi:hypothetical protein
MTAPPAAAEKEETMNELSMTETELKERLDELIERELLCALRDPIQRLVDSGEWEWLDAERTRACKRRKA